MLFLFISRLLVSFSHSVITVIIVITSTSKLYFFIGLESESKLSHAQHIGLSLLSHVFFASMATDIPAQICSDETQPKLMDSLQLLLSLSSYPAPSAHTSVPSVGSPKVSLLLILSTCIYVCVVCGFHI